MGGNSMRIEKVDRLSFDDEKQGDIKLDQDGTGKGKVKKGKVLTFKRKKS